jgi:hypothetical protein
MKGNRPWSGMAWQPREDRMPDDTSIPPMAKIAQTEFGDIFLKK